jgi:hypothetical protein
LDWRVWGDEWCEDEGDVDDEGEYGGQEEIVVAGVRVLPLKGRSKWSFYRRLTKRGKCNSMVKDERADLIDAPLWR